MDKKVAFIFPGQGAQYVGMGKDFYEAFSIVQETFEEANDQLGFNLSKLVFEGPTDELTLTKNSQIAIYVMSVALWRALKQELPEIEPSVVAGLSLGEYTALTASGRLSFKEGIDLVRARGEYMYEAGIKSPGTMAVALGMKPEEVSAVVDPIEGVWVANLNCPGQVVISGTIQGIEKAGALLKEKGAKRVLPLDVSGAFHSGLMEEAKERLKAKIDEVTLNKSAIDLVMNVPGNFVSEGDISGNMINQVVAPVYWEKGVRQMEEKGVELFIEIGPGKTLSGMNRKIGVQGKTLTIEKIEDLEALSQGAINGVT
ncbi:MAG: ACP S-malonyltransferase [Simkaniaceae bacterium]|jgi:[acyl-carrier-protein] S-malonyltransferase|nr:MAG: ACP S-malonyltransferase [Simkaniaceae bacterium]